MVGRWLANGLVREIWALYDKSVLDFLSSEKEILGRPAECATYPYV